MFFKMANVKNRDKNAIICSNAIILKFILKLEKKIFV